jgi:hypothetical protein
MDDAWRLAGKEREYYMHPVAADLELYALKKLAPAKIPAVETHIEGCGSCRKYLQETEAFVQQLVTLSIPQRTAGTIEHRKSRRIATDDPVIVKIIEHEREVSTTARVLDASAGGFCVRVPGPVCPGARIEIHLEGTIALGEVRYCVEAGGSYRLGVQISDVLPNRSGSRGLGGDPSNAAS